MARPRLQEQQRLVMEQCKQQASISSVIPNFSDHPPINPYLYFRNSTSSPSSSLVGEEPLLDGFLIFLSIHCTDQSKIRIFGEFLRMCVRSRDSMIPAFLRFRTGQDFSDLHFRSVQPISRVGLGLEAEALRAVFFRSSKKYPLSRN